MTPRNSVISLQATMPRTLMLMLFCCFVLAAQRTSTDHGIAVQYGPDFAGDSWKEEPKLTQQEIGTDIPEGVAPLRHVLHLKGRLPNRADDNTIEIIPLSDRSVPDFAKAYPGLSSSAAALRSLLAKSQLPGMKALAKADPNTVDAAYSLCARVERLESPWVSGFAFLVQFTQEESGNLANNQELTWQFLGITKDGVFLVDAAFAVSQPSLPKQQIYVNSRRLRESERQLAGLDEGTFQPPLPHLKAVIRSLHFLPRELIRHENPSLPR